MMLRTGTMLMGLFCMTVLYPNEWTWLYKKKFSDSELVQNQEKKEISFTKIEIPHFTQLIFSWNAVRPVQGFLSFQVQVRNAQTKQWGAWHKMFEWGKNIQRSYLDDTQKDSSQYMHVRLEMPADCYADGFRIKAQANNKACLSVLKGFAVNSADFSKFKSEVRDKHTLRLPSVHVQGVPRYSQFRLQDMRNGELCSPTACSMLVSFLLKKPIHPLHFAKDAYDQGLDVYGSWPFNMAHAFECTEQSIWFWTKRCNSFKDVHEQLCRGIPVVVSVRGPLPGSATPYSNGHLLVIVGWDKKRREVICHDPAFKTKEEIVMRYKWDHFLSAWERSRRLTYHAELR